MAVLLASFEQDAWKVEFAAASSTFPKTQQTMRPANRASAKALSSLVVTCFGSTVVNMKVVIHVFNLRLSSWGMAGALSECVSFLERCSLLILSWSFGAFTFMNSKPLVRLAGNVVNVKFAAVLASTV